MNRSNDHGADVPRNVLLLQHNLRYQFENPWRAVEGKLFRVKCASLADYSIALTHSSYAKKDYPPNDGLARLGTLLPLVLKLERFVLIEWVIWR
jgi:dsRNA-specific ribonuclease